jgi:hypothetical protein
MLKTEFGKDMTLEEYFMYNEAIGLTVEINDGQITSVNIEEA